MNKQHIWYVIIGAAAVAVAAVAIWWILSRKKGSGGGGGGGGVNGELSDYFFVRGKNANPGKNESKIRAASNCLVAKANEILGENLAKQIFIEDKRGARLVWATKNLIIAEKLISADNDCFKTQNSLDAPNIWT